jgi:acyl-CoA synthetase (AMP-forming)/AMP-acid ligase II
MACAEEARAAAPRTPRTPPHAPPPPPLATPPAQLVVVPVLDGLRAWAAAWPDDALYVWLSGGAGGESARLTMRGLHERAGGVAAVMTRRWGVTRGDRVLLVYPPGLEFTVALFACFRAGVVAVPVRAACGCGAMRYAAAVHGESASQLLLKLLFCRCALPFLQVYPPDPTKPAAPQLAALARVAASAGARVALTDTPYSWVVAALRVRHGLSSAWPRALAWRVTSRLGAAAPPGFIDAPSEPHGVAFLQFTSGSTSAPKGVMVTHACLAHNCALIRRAMGITAADCEARTKRQKTRAEHAHAHAHRIMLCVR